MEILFLSLVATFIISLVSFVGIITILIKEKLLEKIVFLLIGLSAGTLIGGAFLHLIPEALEKYSKQNIFIYILSGFSLFFILERVIKWHHCHKNPGGCEVHSFTHMNLIGDAFHNFLDGLVVFAAFSSDIKLGIITSLMVILHEIPQEIGDFGVLLYGGFSKKKALFYNFISALFAVLGSFVGYFLYLKLENFSQVLLALTAGGFIYISASDLIPELHKEKEIKKSITAFVFFLLGIFLMFFSETFLG